MCTTGSSGHASRPANEGTIARDSSTSAVPLSGASTVSGVVAAGRAELTHGAVDAIDDHTPILIGRQQIGAPTARLANESPVALLAAHTPNLEGTGARPQDVRLGRLVTVDPAVTRDRRPGQGCSYVKTLSSRVTPDPAPLGSGASPSSSRPATVERMLSKRMEHVGIVVEDMDGGRDGVHVAREVEEKAREGLVMSTLGFPHGR